MECPCANLPVPYMFVPKQQSIARRNAFLGPKYKRLSRELGRPDAFFEYYPAAGFLNLLTMMDSEDKLFHIYFICDNGLLSLMYGIDTPGGAETYFRLSTAGLVSVTGAEAQSLTAAYRTDKLPLLAPYCNPALPSDTVCVTHTYHDILEFADEIRCQEPSAITAYFGTYLPDEYNHPGNPKHLYSRQLMVEFCLMKVVNGIEDDFFIDDCENFEGRRNIPPSPGRHSDKLRDFNNGSLCPPCKDCNDGDVRLNTDDCM